MTTQQFHNPQNLTPQQYGADQGWRLLTTDELRSEVPVDSQYYDEGSWRIRIGTGCGCAELSYRTRAPLPVEDDGWVSISERKPTLEDFPVVAHRHLLKDKIWFADEDFYSDNCTHWKRYREEPPAPEPKAITREEDHNAFYKQYAKLRTGDNGRRTMWDAAIAYERAKYRALIDRYNNSDLKAHEFIHAVGEMCK